MRIINLLPKEKQSELHYEEIFHSVSVAAALAGIILLLGLIGQLAVRVYLGQQIKSVQAKIEQTKRLTNKTENNELKLKIKLDNAEMTDFKNLAETTPAWSKVLLAFSAQVPDGIHINLLTADAATKRVTVNGQSPTRDAVIQLYNNIVQDSGNFRDIDYPLENVAKPTDVAFHYTFYIKDDLLSGKK